MFDFGFDTIQNSIIMKKLINFKNYKSIIVASVIVIGAYYNSYSQQCTYTAKPSCKTYGTGRADLFKRDGEIKAGTSFPNNFEGWVNFWVGLTQQSGSTLKIDDVDIRTYTNAISSSPKHILEYEEMTVDPFTASRSAIRNDIGSNTRYTYSTTGRYIGWSYWIDLKTSAEIDLQAVMNSGPGYFPVGFTEYGMDDHRCVIDGRNDAHPPELRVTYRRVPDNPLNPTSNSPQCSSVTIYRNGTVPSGQTWYWQNTSCGTSISYGSGSTFKATSSGTYYIRARHNTCGTWSSNCGSVTVTVMSTPGKATVSGPSSACQDDNKTFDASASNATSYSWTAPSGWSPSSGSGSSFTTTVGSNSGDVTATPSNSCGNGSSGNKYVNVTSIPSSPTGVSATDTYGDKVRITWNIVNGATSYDVKRGSTPVCTNTTDTSYDDYSAPNSSTQYCVYANNSCGHQSSAACDNGYATHVEEISVTDIFKIYPNPANDKLFIEVVNNGNKIKKMELFNSIGQLILIKEGKELDVKIIEIDLSRYKTGIYYLDLKTKEGNLRNKVSIVR